MVRILAAGFLLTFFALTVSAHPGDKDEAGCHRDANAGTMHCHDKEGSILPWPPVKKSREDICHDRKSPWYDRTIHFESFKSMQACLESGGRKYRS